MSAVAAAQSAGYNMPKSNAQKVEKRAVVQAALQKEWARAEKAADISKKEVMEGLKDAIDQAKLLADPTAQISGWREIAKMCGYYEPQRLQVEVSVSAKRVLSQFEALSDEELLKLAEQEVIDVEAFEVNSDNEQSDQVESLEYSPDDEKEGS